MWQDHTTSSRYQVTLSLQWGPYGFKLAAMRPFNPAGDNYLVKSQEARVKEGISSTFHRAEPVRPLREETRGGEDGFEVALLATATANPSHTLVCVHSPAY